MKILNATILLFIILLGLCLNAQIALNRDNKQFNSFFNITAKKNDTSSVNEVQVCLDGVMAIAYNMRLNPESGVEKQLLLIKVDSAVISFIDVLMNKVVKLYKVSELEEVREKTTLIPHLRRDKCFELEFQDDDEKKNLVNICVPASDKAEECKVGKYLFNKSKLMKIFKIMKNCSSILEDHFRKLREREEMLRRLKELEEERQRRLKKKLSEDELAQRELDKALEAARLEAERRRNRTRFGKNPNDLSDSDEDLINGLLRDYENSKNKRKRKSLRKRGEGEDEDEEGSGRFNRSLLNELNNITLKVNRYAELQFNRTENMSLYEGFQIPSDLLEYFKKAFDCLSKNTGSFVNEHHPHALKMRAKANSHKTGSHQNSKNIHVSSFHAGIKTENALMGKDKGDQHHEDSADCNTDKEILGNNSKYRMRRGTDLNINVNVNKPEDNHKRHLRHFWKNQATLNGKQ
jgi:hypothetical protein